MDEADTDLTWTEHFNSLVITRFYFEPTSGRNNKLNQITKVEVRGFFCYDYHDSVADTCCGGVLYHQEKQGGRNDCWSHVYQLNIQLTF